MIIFQEIQALQKHLSIHARQGNDIGFVPTMGALHEGHLSLVRTSKSLSGLTVCSIFVNPTQFNDPSDFNKYPVTTASDIQLLEKEGTDILFLPSVEEMYPSGLATIQHYKLGYLETILEGAHRPGHFQGVCQVVHRLLDIVRPHRLFLGQKDYQQCMVLRKLVKDLAMPVETVIGKTVREPGGLAMSSRNLRLTTEQKERASAMHAILSEIKNTIGSKTFGGIQEASVTALLNSGFEKVDYVAIADAGTLQLQDAHAKWDGKTSLVALAAAFIGNVRLIDNVLLT